MRSCYSCRATRAGRGAARAHGDLTLQTEAARLHAYGYALAGRLRSRLAAGGPLHRPPNSPSVGGAASPFRYRSMRSNKKALRNSPVALYAFGLYLASLALHCTALHCTALLNFTTTPPYTWLNALH